MPPQAATMDFVDTTTYHSSSVPVPAIDDALFGQQGIDLLFSSGKSYLDDLVVTNDDTSMPLQEETILSPSSSMVASSTTSTQHVTSTSSMRNVQTRAQAPPAPPAVVPEEEEEEPESPPPMQKPRRMLTPYNIFFKDERARLLAEKQQGRGPKKLGFAELARAVSAKWKTLSKDDKKHYEYRSQLDKQRHAREMAAWRSAGGGGDAPVTTGKRARTASRKVQDEAPVVAPRYKSQRLAARRRRTWGNDDNEPQEGVLLSALAMAQTDTPTQQIAL